MSSLKTHTAEQAVLDHASGADTCDGCGYPYAYNAERKQLEHTDPIAYANECDDVQPRPIDAVPGGRHGWLELARTVVAGHGPRALDGMALDRFTASVMVAVHDGLSAEYGADFAAMPLEKAAPLAWKLYERGKA